MELTREKTIMNVVLYTRVSTKEQVENFSLSSQEKVCREFAEKQGWNIIQIFQEEGESAKTADRTQLLKLLNYCSKNKGNIDAVLIYKVDRISRNSADYQSIKATLSRYGVVIRAATETINETPQGKFMENVFAAIAQLDNDNRAERTRAGLKERVRQGLWAWAPPLGYKSGASCMVIDKEKAPFVRQAFELYATGNYSIKEIAGMFNKWEVKSKNGKKLLPQTVTKILENKLYMGIIEVNGWDGEVEGIHEKIITPELFYKAKAVREGKSVSAVPRLVNNPEFPLRGIARCSSCYKYLTGSKSSGRKQKYPYYHCICGGTRVRKEVLEEAFLYFLKQIQPNEEFIKIFNTLLVEVWKKKQNSKISELQKIDKNLFILNGMKNTLIQKNLNGVIGDDDFKEQLDSIKSQIKIKEIERSDIREDETNIDYLISISEELFRKVSIVWLDAPFEQKLKFQNLLFPKGIVFKDENIGTEELGLPFKLIPNAEVEKTTLVPRRGVEPLILWLKTRCPRPLDDRGSHSIIPKLSGLGKLNLVKFFP